MIHTITEYQFISAFESSDTYKNNFTYEALVEMFAYFEACEEESGESIEFDMVGVCCDYTQANYKEIIGDYNIELEHPENNEDLHTYVEQVHEFLLENSPSVIALLDEDNSFVYVNF